jgi:hypothetical protein
MEASDQFEELLAAQTLEETRRFRHVTDAVLHVDGTFRERKTSDRNSSAGRRQNAGEDFDRRALAGSIGTQQADNFTFVEAERNLVENLRLAIAKDEPVDFDQRGAQLRFCPPEPRMIAEEGIAGK